MAARDEPPFLLTNDRRVVEAGNLPFVFVLHNHKRVCSTSLILKFFAVDEVPFNMDKGDIRAKESNLL